MSSNQSHFGIVGGVIGTGAFILFAVLAFLQVRTQPWIVALFAIPFLVQFRGVWLLYKKFRRNTARVFFCWFYLTTMSLCLFTYSALWGIYSYFEHENGWLLDSSQPWQTAPRWFDWLSIFVLCAITVLLLLVIRMTRAIIEGQSLSVQKLESHNQGIDGRYRRRGKANRAKLWDLNNLRTGASDEPFLTLGFFFTVFLGLSYMFGFALAFHDKVRPPDTPALYMRNLNPWSTVASNRSNTGSAESPPPIAGEFSFRFIEGMASFPLASEPEPNYSAVADNNETRNRLKKAWWEACEANGSQLLRQEDLTNTLELAGKLREENALSTYIRNEFSQNTRRLLQQEKGAALVSASLSQAMLTDLNHLINGPLIFADDRFKSVSLSEATLRLIARNPAIEEHPHINRLLLAEAYPAQITRNKIDSLLELIRVSARHHDRIRISVIGFSDSTQIKGRAYQSNYELAEARAQNTKQIIADSLVEALEKQDQENIEWSCLSLSNEQEGSERIVKVKLEPSRRDSASILLSGDHPNPLSLLDYVYFANYTITTTGYGDIVPLTAYSKFICSFANIVEVFFLVVFFNVLVSLRRKHSAIVEADVNPSDTQSEFEGGAANDDAVDFHGAGEAEKSLKILEQRDNENRVRISQIEESLKSKAEKADIETQVKEMVKMFLSNPFRIFR